MNLQDLLDYHDCSSKQELSRKMLVSRITLWKWEKEGIPLRTQALLEIKSKGILKADLLSKSSQSLN
ncbi:hypothetical protein RG113_003758 [Acinetobacter baumannii]|uniref:hypothetical protein n=1 Tax=Acinetobacter baumannii TaxID=470 RepID=UPI0003E5AB8E|nr:hypothetical protein [Acinetobacter baumannii]ETY69616.1 hypothetical protein X964_04180 [Acinetobacter baumannii MDR_MMC4]AIL77474.1 hypothetical protein IX87_02160 [Acinetobacter baumannii]APJ19752.1 hypothetical protein BS064_11800 [Acinetobacter baumannii]KQK45901.1 hypothetical protein AQ482_11860 [Acinetobacter baumannii]KRI74270.1 hypothetical protein APC65_14820 [Acinetobacter baumannii]